MSFICPECNREFDSKKGLSNHIRWHNPKFREKMKKIQKIAQNTPESKEKKSKSLKEVWNQPGYRENHNGDKSSMFGKFGKDHPTFKEDAGITAKHNWIRKYYPQKVICNDKCEICAKFNLNLNLARFRDNNERNMEDPMIDYLYICPNSRKKNSCHLIYDNNLFDKEKEELLAGATTREEKLERVREFVLKNKINSN